MSTATNRFAPEVRARAVRMVMDHEGDHASRRAALSRLKIRSSRHSLRQILRLPEKLFKHLISLVGRAGLEPATRPL